MKAMIDSRRGYKSSLSFSFGLGQSSDVVTAPTLNLHCKGGCLLESGLNDCE